MARTRKTKAADRREKIKKQSEYVPAHLGKRSIKPIDKVDLIPWKGSAIEITLECQEFSSLCPVTGQPDYATLSIRYQPRRHLVETKSLKLYLWSYRNVGIFNEEIVDRVANDLFSQIKPQWLEVEGKFHIRGGIVILAKARREKK